MGNRILKDSILMSQQVDALDWFEEIMFYRLIVTADDYGICPADPLALVHLLFPLKDNVKKDTVVKALEKMESQGLIIRYRVKDKGLFLKLVTWERHQRLRNSKKHYPLPDESEAVEEADSPGAETVEAAPATTDEPASESLPKELAEVRELPVVELPLVNGTDYPVTQSRANEYAELYPAVDIVQELKKMRGWCLANPKRRKTKNGIEKFIHGWLAREQDRGGCTVPGARAAPDNLFVRMAMEPDGDEPPVNPLFKTIFSEGAVK